MLLAVLAKDRHQELQVAERALTVERVLEARREPGRVAVPTRQAEVGLDPGLRGVTYRQELSPAPVDPPVPFGGA